MVHIVKKRIGNYDYLYLQKSFHIKGKNKKRTEHVAYLGKEGKFNEEQMKEILKVANESTKKQLKELLKKYKKRRK